MNKKHENSGLKIALVCLLLCTAIPSSLRLFHAIHGHAERECLNEARLHLHGVDYDCIFDAFKGTTPFCQPLSGYELWVPAMKIHHPRVAYSFLHSFQPLAIALRGPPGC